MKILVCKDKYGIQEIVGVFGNISKDDLSAVLKSKGINVDLDFGINKKGEDGHFMWFNTEVYGSLA